MLSAISNSPRLDRMGVLEYKAIFATVFQVTAASRLASCSWLSHGVSVGVESEDHN